MKRKILLTICLILAAICTVGFVACKEQEDIKLLNWQNETVEIGYGQTYTLDLVAEDDKGNTHILTASVKKDSGEKVEILNGKFVASEKCDYIITYKFSKGEISKKRTVTVKVVADAEPIINVDGWKTTIVVGSDYPVPEATVYDYYDGDISEYQVKVMKKSDGGDTEVSCDLSSGSYIATELGEFYFLYSAKNSNDIVGTAQLEFGVKAPEYFEYLAKVEEETHDVIYNKDIADQGYFAADSEELKAIEGGYTGNAKRFKIWSNPNFNLKSNLTKKTVEQLAKTYNSVSMWIAVTGIETGNAYMTVDSKAGVTNSLQYAATGGQLGLKQNQGKWFKLVVPTDKFAELIVNGEFIKLFYIWCDGMPAANESNAYVYVGDIKFENQIIITNKDINSVYVSASEWKADGITGDYTGDAVKFTGGVNSGFIYKNNYTQEKLAELKETYNTVSLKFAVDIDGGSFYLYTSGFEGIASPGQTNYNATNGNIGKWLTWSISIDDYITLVAENNYEFFRPWGGVANNDAYSWGIPEGTKIRYYFGEIEFSYVAPTVLTITQSNYTNVYNPDVSSSFISAADLAALNIEGDYSGNAVRFNISNAATNGGYRINVPYSVEELTALKDKFDTVSTWVCVTGITSNSLNINSNITDNFGAKAGVKGFGVTPTWQKISVSMDDFISLIGQDGTCRLIATAHWSNATYDNPYLYFGDFVFEKVAE